MKRPNFLFGKSSLAAKGSTNVLREDPAFDVAGRSWPILAAPPQNRISELEKTVAKLSSEVNLRCTQVAELYNIQQERANDVIAACDEIDNLGQTIDALQGTIAQREMEAAAAKNKAIELEKENATLRHDLDNVRKDLTESQQRLLSVETALNDRETSFNDRESSIVAAQEKNSQLNNELVAKWHDVNEFIATVERANEERRSKCNQQSAQLDNQMEKIKTVAAEQNTQARNLELARTMLLDYCDSLIKTVSSIESMKGDLRRDFVTQTRHIFELARTTNCKSNAPKTTEYTSELRHESLGPPSGKTASADRRESVVVHLPKVSALRARAS